MMKPFFSIVMPAYNAEKYIGLSIKSIQEQKFQDWEMLIIEDCSKDKTLAIIEQFAGEDSRIRVLSQDRNRGVSAARNWGIGEATGEYLWFVDADDTVENNLLLRVYDSLQKNRAQLVIFGLIEEYYDEKGRFLYRRPVSHGEGYYVDTARLRQEFIYLEQETLYGYPWNKVYNLSYLKKLRIQFADYETAKFIEDISFNIEFCMDIESLNILDFCPYHYAKRVGNNLTHEFVPQYYELHKNRIELLLEQFQYWGMDNSEVLSILGSLYARYILSSLQQNCDPRSRLNHAERYKWCRRLFAQGLFNRLIPAARAKDSRVLSLLLMFLRWKKSVICLGFGRIVYIVKRIFPQIYSKMKSGR